MSPSPATPHRLLVLDALRGLAAIVVVVAHTLQIAYSTEHPILHSMGRFGVILFFLVSGFVIPPAFARNSSQRIFWTRRLCRLVPLYWCTIAVAALLLAAGWLPHTSFYPARLPTTYLVNLTMVPNLFGLPSVLSVFWSLHIEVLFYALVAVMGLLRLQHKPLVIGLVLIAGALSSPLIPSMTLYYPVFLALVWCGVILQHAIAQHQPLVMTMPFIVATLGMVVLGEGTSGIGPYHIGATGTALIVFLIALRRPTWFCWRGLVWLGTISYSLYLTHLLALAVVPAVGTPLVSMAVWLGAMLAVAAIAERWIERPSITLGRWLTQPRRREAPSQNTVPLATTNRVAHRL